MNKPKFLSLFKRGSDINKKQKPKKPENIYYSPADDMSPLWQYVGLALRTLTLYIGVFGISSFICGAAGLMSSSYWQAVVVSPGTLALLCLPVALAAAIASLGKIPALITPFAYAGAYMGIIAIAYGNPIDFTVKSALRIYNYALYTVSARGYYSLGNFMVNDGYDYTTASGAFSDPYRFCGAFLLATLIGFILYFCIQKKTRIFPIVILMTVVFAPILTYNVAQGNSGIAFMLVFICSALALGVYDYRYGGKALKKAERIKEKAEKKKERAEKKLKKKAARKALINEADRVFDKAIDADVPLKKARQARLAVFKNHKEQKHNEKLAKKAAKKLEKKNLKKAAAEKKKRIKALKKEFSKLPKKSPARETVLSKIKAETAGDTAKKAEKKSAANQRRKEKKARELKARKTSMAGGYTAFGVALIAFIAVWLPLAVVDGPFNEIKPINSRVQTVRAYVTAYLRGSDVDLNDPYVYGIDSLAPRKLSFEPLELDDRLLFRVDAEGTSNVYLRSWVASDFNWDENTWLSGTYEDVHKYREEFGVGFTPDSIKTDYYNYVYPSSAVITDANTYKNFTKYGFTVQQIDVWRVRGSSLLLFIPAHMNTDVGLLDYSEYAPAPYKYQNYYEGTYSSFYYRYGRGYGTVSYVTALNRSDTQSSIDASLLYYNICKEYLKDAPTEGFTDEEVYIAITESESRFAELGIEYQGTSIIDRYYNSMTVAEREELKKSFETEEKYRNEFVLPTYTKKAENEKIAEIATKLRDDAVAKEIENGEDGVLSSHEAVMAIVEYFRSEEFYYTETPNTDLVKGNNKPVIVSFLTDVKQGYCSHFASAAVFLLREMDIPCRYVEGYIATDFEAMGTNGAKTRSSIYGTDAHAWIEVYIDNMGWMQYEVTPGELCEDMYDPNSDTIDPDIDNITNEEEEDDTPKPPMGITDDDDDNFAPNDDFEIEEEVSDLVWFIRLVFIGLGICAFALIVYLVIRFIRKRAWEAMNARYTVIDTAKNMDAYYDEKTDSRGLARSINDWILEVYSTIGCQPQPGELPSEFALRMHEDYGDLSTVDVRDVIEAMQKEEFGHGLTYNELNSCAVYLEEIIASVYAGMSPWQKLVTRYFKRKI
ncbi:MAG: transglutaminase domain-containing protein [Clostridia bacterium]|nr:transglutaminase domain-containing protein [Clostridia bacterium]